MLNMIKKKTSTGRCALWKMAMFGSIKIDLDWGDTRIGTDL